MSYLIQRIAKLAVQTFSRDMNATAAGKQSAMMQLGELVSRVTTKDLGLDSLLIQEENVSNLTEKIDLFLLIWNQILVNSPYGSGYI